MPISNELHVLCAQFCQDIALFKGRVRLIPFEPQAWFRCVYFSIQRTVTGGLPQDSYEQLRHALFDAIYALPEQPQTAEAFEEWIASTIQKHAEQYGISIGQAQKLINLLLKYYYCYYHADIDPSWNAQHQFIVQYSPFFHIPLDNYVLVSLKLKYACPAIHINRSHTYATLRVGDELVSWSRLEDLPTYVQMQGFVQEMMGNHLHAFDSALHFEMAELYFKP
jgi:hypothetical protein